MDYKARKRKMKTMRKNRYFYREIGERFGISRSRVHQILNGYGKSIVK